MPFNSPGFIAFFVIFYALYLTVMRWRRAQNLLLLAGSYIFYAAWEVRFLGALLALTLVNFTLGLWLGRTTQEHPALRRLALIAGLLVNLSALAYFKYAGFFAAELGELLGSPPEDLLAGVLLPVGISFYSLQLSGYLMDVHGRRVPACRSLLDFAVFAGFFPQLLSGPIERAGHMLPQIQQRRTFDASQASAGLYLLLSGFFKKMVVADNLGKVTDQVFTSPAEHAGVGVVIGVLAFAFQLYADFSAYSDIARGLARLMGFELMVNFRLPYFAQSPAEFWQRWHISLSEWLRDYIFYPLRRSLLRGKNRWAGRLALLLPPLVTMLASGLWHGTGWNFIAWGAFHGVLLIAYQAFQRKENGRAGVVSLLRMGLMFILVCFGWLLFRAETLAQAGEMLRLLLQAPATDMTKLGGELVFFSLPLIIIQTYQQWTGDLLALARMRAPLRMLLYGGALAWMVVFGLRQATEFIYVQF